MRKPWFRKQTKCWYVTVDGEHVRLDPDKSTAFEIWHQICAASDRKAEKNPTFDELLTDYCQDTKRQVRNGEVSEKTVDDYLSYLNRFAAVFGETAVGNLEPQHLTDWLNDQPGWGNASQRGAITAVNCVMNWGRREKRIAENPFERYRKPLQNRRDYLIPDADHRAMILAVRDGGNASLSDKQFQLVLVAIKHTGGRPQDISRATVENVSQDGKRWVLPMHKRLRHTMQPKVVYLSPCLQTVTRMISSGRKEGPLFQGRNGTLTVNAIGCRIKRLKKQLNLPAETIAYAYRHTYITDALERGVDIATVAELVGTSVQMIERHYGHLSKRHDHLSNSAAKAINVNP